MQQLRLQSATAWRRVTCGSSDHGLPALGNEPIVGFRADEFSSNSGTRAFILRIRGRLV